MHQPGMTISTDLREIAAIPAPLEASLVAIEGPELGRRYALERELTIGRGPDVDIDIGEDQTSRLHARLRRLGDDGHCIEDLESRNGTEVNGSLIGDEVFELNSGDRLRFGGRTVLLFVRRSPPERRAAEAREMEALGRQGAALAGELSPLIGAVRANLDYLRGLPASLRDPKVRECLEDIGLAMKRAAARLERLAGLSGCIPEKYEPVDVTELVYDVSKLARARFPSTIAIELHVDPNLALIGNQAALHGLLTILCANARDAMPSGGRLTLRAEEASVAQLRTVSLPSVGRHAVLTVEDDGQGMDEATRKRAFEPFFTTRRRGPGGGLGLATAREVARLHRGAVTLESRQEGTTVRVYLPLGTSKKFRVPVSTADGLRPPYRRAGDSRRILLMDGEEVVAKTAARLLASAGYEVTSVRDGQAAVDWCKQAEHAPNLVILDCDAPGLPARDVLGQIRALGPKTRILLTSTLDDGLPDWAEADMPLMTKPWNSDSLQRAVAEAIRDPEPPRT